jgi:hypothetical protein
VRFDEARYRLREAGIGERECSNLRRKRQEQGLHFLRFSSTYSPWPTTVSLIVFVPLLLRPPIVAAVSYEQPSREIQDQSSPIKGPAPGASFHSAPHRR